MSASACFLTYALCHAVLAALSVAFGGHLFVTLIALALVWDNAVLGLGRRFFPKAAIDEKSSDFQWLSTLSQPRFIAHALLTPFLAVPAVELGGRAGVAWLTPRIAMNIHTFCHGISLLGVLHHFYEPRLVPRKPHPKEPKGSWMRQIVSVTLATLQDKDISPTAKSLTLLLMIGPAVLVCLLTLAIGASIAAIGQQTANVTSVGGAATLLLAGRCLWISAVLELLSNGGPPWTMAITGNAGEVILLAGFVAADWLL